MYFSKIGTAHQKKHLQGNLKQKCLHLHLVYCEHRIFIKEWITSVRFRQEDAALMKCLALLIRWDTSFPGWRTETNAWTWSTCDTKKTISKQSQLLGQKINLSRGNKQHLKPFQRFCGTVGLSWPVSTSCNVTQSVLWKKNDISENKISSSAGLDFQEQHQAFYQRRSLKYDF